MREVTHLEESQIRRSYIWKKLHLGEDLHWRSYALERVM